MWWRVTEEAARGDERSRVVFAFFPVLVIDEVKGAINVWLEKVVIDEVYGPYGWEETDVRLFKTIK